MRDVAREYGGVAYLRFVFRKVWLVTEPSVIESVLVTQSRLFRGKSKGSGLFEMRCRTNRSPRTSTKTRTLPKWELGNEGHGGFRT